MHESSITETLARKLYAARPEGRASWEDLREDRRQTYYRLVETMLADYHRLLRAGLKAA